MKQWKNKNLNVIYFHMPNSKNDEVLTSDGILIPFNEFKVMSIEDYNSRKNNSSIYDYDLSLKSERLVKKAVSNHNVDITTELSEDVTETVKETLIEETKPVKKIKKMKTPLITNEDLVPIIKDEIKNEKSNSNVWKKMLKLFGTINKYAKKKKFNLFEWAYPKIMVFLMILCSCLSIYFTATYLQRLQNVIISYMISTCMLLFGIIGFQIARQRRKEQNKVQTFIYYFTSITVILFSMLSSIDVNYSKYKASHSNDEIVYNTNDGIRMSYELIEKEIEDNKKLIEKAQNDIKFQQTQYILSWDSEKGKSVPTDRITQEAQDNIKEYEKRIKELDERNKELNGKLIEYAQSGISMNTEEGKLEKSKSLTDLLGRILHSSSDVIQLIFLLVPSFFIDIINILAVTIYCDRFEKRKKKIIKTKKTVK